MSSRLKKVAQFHSKDSQDKNSSFEGEHANRNEIKRIDNNSEKGFTTEFDKLNESIYQLNNYLKLSKDIDDIKKESVVKNDIQRKLSMKSQWLNSNTGSSNTSLNSLPPIDQSSNRNAEQELKKNSKNFSISKTRSAHNVNAGKSSRRKNSIHNSCDELNFVDKLKLSNEDITRLSQEPEFRGSIRKVKKSGSSNSLKVEVPLQRVRSASDSRESALSGSSIMKSSSQRDLSKYFPKTEVKQKQTNINKNQKELKDVDLSKYFLPAPVQELKSLPSPGQSPKLPRKPIAQKSFDESSTNLLRTAIDNSQKLNKRLSTELTVDLPKRQYFTMHDQQLDGDVTLKIPVFTTIPSQQAQNAEMITDDNCDAFFNSLKSPTDNLDEIFNKVAADALPGTSKAAQQQGKTQTSASSLPKPSSIQYFGPQPVEKPKEIKPDVAMSTDRQKYCLNNKSEADILGKLSSNLLNEIKLLEKHLELNEKQIESNATNKPIKNVKKSEEELNNVIDDIFNSSEKENKPQAGSKLAVKQNAPAASKLKKVTYVKLPKAMKGTKTEQKPPISAANSKPKTVEIKSFETPVPAPRAKLERVQSIDKEKSAKESTAKVTKPLKLKIIAKAGSIDETDSPINVVSFSFKPKLDNTKVEQVTLSLPMRKARSTTPECRSNRVSNDQSSTHLKPSFGGKARSLSKERVPNNQGFPTVKLNRVDPKSHNTDILSPKSSLNEARKSLKAYFSDLNHDSSKSSTTEPYQTKEIVNKSKPESIAKNEPPIKPIRRRKLSSQTSRDEQINGQGQHESFSSASTPTQNIEPKYKSDIPELNNIVRILNSSESPKTNKKELVQPNHEQIDINSNENGTNNTNHVERRNPTDDQRTERKSFVSGDYDNMPSTSRRAMFKESKALSKSLEEPSETNRDYDNVIEQIPPRPRSVEKRPNTTEMLVERSKAIHNKKQDYIEKKLVETNPYMRRMIEKEHRFRPSYNRSYVSPARSTNHYDYQPYSHSYHRPTMSSSTLNSSTSHMPRSTLPSTSNRSVLDLFRQPPSSNNKDNCIIS